MSTPNVAPKKRGNPFLVKKTQTEAEVITDDLNKQYVFQLLRTHTKQKPVDNETGLPVGSPFQPFFAVPNSGVAWDNDYVNEKTKKKGAQRRWRFLYNYPTIWVDEQIEPEPTKEDLAAAENDLTFRNGVLRVFGHETCKLQAMKLNNAFEDCQRPLKNIPKDYKLLDQEKIDKEVLQVMDDAYEAEKSARDASLDDMYAVAHYLGINMQSSDDSIRKEFIKKARENPKMFNREYINPKHKAKYTLVKGLADNVISDIIIPGTLYWVDTRTKLLDLSSQDTAEELSVRYLANDKDVVSLLDRLNRYYEGIE